MKRGLIALLSIVTFGTQAFAAEYKIDSDHSTVGFKIKHLAISTVPGRFTEFTGTFQFDPAKVESSSTDVSIAVKSISTEQTKRDDHLKGPEFFDVAKFPSMTFKSTKTTPVSKDEFKVLGDLTIHGVTKPTELSVKYGGSAKDPWGNERAAFSATAHINRKDFGLTWNKALEAGGLLVGEEVDITIEVEGIKKP